MFEKATKLKLKWPAVFLLLVLSSASPVAGQTTKFDKYRQWSDTSGKFKTTAQVMFANCDSVTIKSESGKSLTIPLDRLSSEDQEFALEYQEAVLSKLKKDASVCVFASQALTLYREFETSGFVDTGNREAVETRIAELKAQSDNNAILLPEGFVSEEKWPAKKARASEMISQWLKEVRSERQFEKKQTLLRSAIAEDPTSTEGAILLALYHEIRDADFKIAQRHLEESIEQGTRYLPIATDSDKSNLIAATNNLAISYARTGRVSKAVKIWSLANEVSGFALPNGPKHNLAKVQRMIKNNRSGLSADRATTKEVDELVARTSATGSAGGWRLLAPQDSTGKSRNDLSFVVGDASFRQNDGTIEDARCVKCVGTGRKRCPNRLCHGGRIKTPVMGKKYLTFPDGTRHAAGYGIIGYNQVICKTCKGQTLVVCPYCKKGVQKN